jgi:hypothetical protein
MTRNDTHRKSRALITYFPAVLLGDTFAATIDEMIYTIAATVGRKHSNKALVEISDHIPISFVECPSCPNPTYAPSPYVLEVLEAYVYGLLWPQRLEAAISACTLHTADPAPSPLAVTAWLHRKSKSLIGSAPEQHQRELFSALLLPTCVSARYRKVPLYYSRYRNYDRDYRSFTPDVQELPGFTDNMRKSSLIPAKIIAHPELFSDKPVLLTCTALSILATIVTQCFRLPAALKLRVTSNADAAADWCNTLNIFFTGPLCFIRLNDTELLRPHPEDSTIDGTNYTAANIVYAWLLAAHALYPQNTEIGDAIHQIRNHGRVVSTTPGYMLPVLPEACPT